MYLLLLRYRWQMFTSASTVVLKTFACDDGVVDGQSYLRADYSISCRTDLHVWFQVYAAIMILVSSQISRESGHGHILSLLFSL